MDLRIFTEPQQGATYDDLLAVARVSEEEGFSAFFRSDHYLAMGDSDGLPGPTDAWITLAGLARDTTHIRLGTLVSSATFRLPGPLAVAVAGVDAMSGGRVELGLGAGWYLEEHEAYGIPFPSTAARFEVLEEQLSIITGLWATPAGETFSFDGRHFRLKDSPALISPVQSPFPIIVGGHGRRKTPALVARFASEFNVAFSSPAEVADLNGVVTEACRAAGRDPAAVRRTAAVVVCCGSDDAEIARRAAAIGRDVDELKANGACGTPDEVAAKLRGYAAAGAEGVYLQILDLADLDHLRLLGREVIPRVA
ncbi:MAG: LLM class F420-dependent oxidoreductase [Acidimicrobiaceae bacterium]|nr:LLM class F420-dependent oxidoreductase [Acidimicrobiaceae bacterium]MBO0748165.1 LLM class F420-dependent oxidoreductase [Acidimicrobiaceae bacterium]